MADEAITKLTGAPWIDAPASQRVIGALEAVRPGSARFVGGCVRNAIMRRPAGDIDIATQLPPLEAKAALEAAGVKVFETGIEHGTITAVADHQPFEITSLRRDVETDGRRAVVAFTEDWAEDAQRRDFRLNAIYAGPDGALYDPTGHGVEDARAGRVIFVGEPEHRIREDYLRILRFFRFNAWYARDGFDEAGLKACGDLAGGMAGLSAERVWAEFKKLLDAPDPRRAVRAMAAAGVLAQILPRTRGLEVFERMAATEAAQFLTPEPLLRMAALLEPGAEPAREAAQRLKLSNDERQRLVRIAEPDGPRLVSFLSPKEVRRALYLLGKETFCDRVRLAWAMNDKDAAAPQWRALLAMAEGWSRPVLPIDGRQVQAAGVEAGPKVGEVLREVEAWWIDSDFTMDELSVIERLKAVAQALG